MADATIDNGDLGNLEVSTKTLSGGVELEGVELVTAVEGGARTDLAKQLASAFSASHFGLLGLAVRRDTPTTIADANGDYGALSIDDEGKLWVNIGEAIAAGRGSDSISSALATDALMVFNTACVPKFAKASIAASTTDGALVAAVTSKKIRVISFRIMVGGTATNVTFRSKPGGAGSDISELFACGANGGSHGAFSPVGHFETVAGEGLSVSTGAGSASGIGVVYIEV
jgi:hypothetical protein